MPVILQIIIKCTTSPFMQSRTIYGFKTWCVDEIIMIDMPCCPTDSSPKLLSTFWKYESCCWLKIKVRLSLKNVINLGFSVDKLIQHYFRIRLSPAPWIRIWTSDHCPIIHYYQHWFKLFSTISFRKIWEYRSLG